MAKQSAARKYAINSILVLERAKISNWIVIDIVRYSSYWNWKKW